MLAQVYLPSLLTDADDVEVWSGVPQMTQEACRGLVARLEELAAEGYAIVTWNGASFDFFVLGQESGQVEQCGALALDHVDLMVIVTFSKGYYLGLDKALAGAGLAGKLKAVTLQDGATLTDMDGSQPPKLWQAGEQAAVIEYLKQDVTQLLGLADTVERTQSIRWLSNRGKPQAVRLRRLLSVRDCFQISEPDTSWMRNPPSRGDFVRWIPDWQRQVG